MYVPCAFEVKKKSCFTHTLQCWCKFADIIIVLHYDLSFHAKIGLFIFKIPYNDFPMRVSTFLCDGISRRERIYMYM